MPEYELTDWVLALESAGCKPRGSGDSYKARCPAHDDKNPSLRVSRGEKQEVLVYCHAGCTFEAIRGRLGLDSGDKRAGEPRAVAARPANGRYPTPKPLPAGAWKYHDADGLPLMAVVRHDRADGSKTFTQWTPKDDGWVSRGLAAPRPLYGLVELAADPEGHVIVVEGEKCADAHRQAWPKRLATTWPGGCKQWQHTDWTPLAGRAVAVLADADKGGRDAAQGIAATLHRLGCEVHVALPEGETGEDVADWLEHGAKHAHDRITELLDPFEPPPALEPAGGVGLGLYGPGKLGIEPLADARRLLDSHAPEMLLAEGLNERGEVETTVHALRPSGLWSRNPERLAQWHDEAAQNWEADAVELCTDPKEARPVRNYTERSRTRKGASEAVGHVPILAGHLRDRDELHEGLTECRAEDLNGLRWLGSPTGVVDLQDGRLLPPAEGRRALVTYSLPDPFDPEAIDPDTEQLTAHLEPALAAYLWRSFAFALLGQPSRTFLVVVGDPGGGKSTLASAVAASLGCYAGPLAEGAISPARGGRAANAATPDMASVMRPRRLAFGAEVEKMRPDVARLKAVTGGDLLPRRNLYKNLGEGTPSATLVLFGNQPPERLGLDDQAVLERARAVPYPCIPEADRDPRLVGAWDGACAAAVRRRQAVVSKLVHYAAEQTHGQPPEPPEEVVAYLEELRDADIGDVGVWLRDHVRCGKESRTCSRAPKSTTLYGAALGAEGEGKDWSVRAPESAEGDRQAGERFTTCHLARPRRGEPSAAGPAGS